MNDAQIRNWSNFTEFLGNVLGPDHEVVLHDLENYEHSIIAIANGHISGRTVGAPLTDLALKMVKDFDKDQADFKSHYKGVAGTGKVLRSSSFFIKNSAGRPVGMICINFDDSRYRQLTNDLMSLIHPDKFIDNIFRNEFESTMNQAQDSSTEHLASSSSNIIRDTVNSAAQKLGIELDNASISEKQLLIAELEKNGIFLLKGAVKDVADRLNMSIATTYRYISKAKPLDSNKTE